MRLKTNDDHKNQRLELLMAAVGNDRLAGEVCPNCFAKNSVVTLPLITNILKPRKIEEIRKGKIREALDKMKQLKKDCILKATSDSDELIKEYLCQQCGRSYVGELNLIANLSETRVLSFFGYDESKPYKEDFYSFPLIDDSYDSFIQDLWDEQLEATGNESTLTPLMMSQTTEDAITGQVLGMLQQFFIKFSNEVYDDIGATVKVYSSYHAGTAESGGRQGVAATGADSAVWVGPMTKEEGQLVDDFVNLRPGSKLPVIVGNGVIFQAKKQNGGSVDRRQIEDLIRYASIEYKDREYFGVPGKLFMNYSVKPPFVTVLSSDYTYKLYQYSKELPEGQKSISFPMSLDKLSEHTAPITLPAFVQSYLSGKIGTPLLMLQDIFATPGPKLIIGLPPELLKAPTTAGQPLSSVVDDWIAVFGGMLESCERAAAALQLAKEEAHLQAQRREEVRRAEQQEFLRRQQQAKSEKRFLTH